MSEVLPGKRLNLGIFGAFFLMVLLVGATTFSLSGSALAQAGPRGTLSFNPASVQNGGSFTISLSGGPASVTATHLLINTSDNDESHYSANFSDFGPWSNATTDSSGSFSFGRTMDCAAYTSYTPGQSVNLSTGGGKKIYQQVKLQWPDGSFSSVATHSKDCTSGTSGGGTQTLCGSPDPFKIGTCPTGQVCQRPDLFTYSCVASNNSPPATAINTLTDKIVPSSATIAVGENIQLHIYRYRDTGSGPVVTEITTGIGLSFDSFYVRQSGSQSGNFLGVTPGTVTLTDGYPGGTATITVTGKAVEGSGIIKISQHKDIYGQMYKTGCAYGDDSCTTASLGSGGVPTKLVADSGPAAISSLEYGHYQHNPNPTGWQDTGPVMWTLDDPFNPVPSGYRGNKADYNSEWAGDPGPDLRGRDFAVSKSGEFRAESLSNNMLVVWVKNAKVDVGLNGSLLDGTVGIVERPNGAFLVAGNETLNLTDADLTGALARLPYGFPTMPPGQKLILGDDNYVADLTGPSFSNTAAVGVPANNQLRIYDLGKLSPVATLDISDVAAGYPGSFIRQKGDADTEYLFFQVTSSSVPFKYINLYNPPRIYGYKYTYSTKTLTKIVNGVQLGESGMVGVMNGFNVGGKIGIFTVTQNGLDFKPPEVCTTDAYGRTHCTGSYPTRFESKAHAYLLSDLTSGTAKEVLANSPMKTDGGSYGGGSGTSIVVGNSTYVYLTDALNTLYVWKLDLSGASSAVAPGGGNPTVTPPSTPAGSCDFTLTPNPASTSVTVPSGQSSYISFGLSSTKPADTTCPAITLSLTTLRDGSGNTVATPLSTSLTISPGNSTVAIYNVSKFPGSYTLPIKAYGRGVQKTVNIQLNVQ